MRPSAARIVAVLGASLAMFVASPPPASGWARGRLAAGTTSGAIGAVGACPADLAERSSGLSGAGQAITVVAAADREHGAKLELWQRRGRCLLPAGGPWLAEVGRNGLSSHHVEGDGTTPIGTFGIGPVMYGALVDPGVAYRWHRLVCGDWWDEDPASPAYNRFVELPCGATPPFGGDSEALWLELPDYDAFAVIDYNVDPTIPGRGSGIFLHVSTGVPTDGCVALPEPELLAVLRWLRPGDHPLVAIATAAAVPAGSARQRG